MAINRHIQHIKSQVVENGAPKLPTSDQIQLGEIAINYASGYETIAIKNASGDVITFLPRPNYSARQGETIHTMITGNTGILGGTNLSAVWNGTCNEITNLYDGLSIAYKIPVAGHKSGTTLSINGGEAHLIVLNASTNLTGHYPVNAIIKLVYDSRQNGSYYTGSTTAKTVQGVWKIENYDSNSDTIGYAVGFNQISFKTNAATYRYVLMFTKDETTLTPVNSVSNNTGSTKTLTTQEFDPFGGIYYKSSTTSVSSGGTLATGTVWTQAAMDLRYSFNTTNTLVATKGVYMVCVPQENGMVKLHSNPISQSLPTTDDGLVYIYLGQAYSTTNIYLVLEHPIYHFKNGKLRRFSSELGNSAYMDVVTAITSDNSGSTNPIATSVVTQNEKVVSNALVSLDERVTDLTSQAEKLIETTYSNLKALRDGGNLKKGTWYRITDYVTTTIQVESQSAGHAFDIVVLATSTNTLNESAWAMKHDGDTYFSGSSLDAWELKYCLDNDDTRFMWADVTNGKGVIYWMKDEFNNECPYDFKNIQFKRYRITAMSKCPSLANTYSSYKTVNSDNTTGATYPSNATIDTSSVKWVYTFDRNGSDYTLKSNKFNNVENVIETYIHDNGKLVLNNITLNNLLASQQCSNNHFKPQCRDMSFRNSAYSNTFGDSCYTNTFGTNCNNNTFGTNCYSNTFGNDCNSNTFGNSCNYNTFGDNYTSNTFGYNCYFNTFGNYCYSNTFGTNCYSNTFGNDCNSNTFGNFFSNNTFGDNCTSNTFGNDCNYNTFGNFYYSNTFGNSCYSNTFGKAYTQYIIVENGNKNITLTSTQTTSDSMMLQNIKIAQGVNNTTTSKTISHDTLNDEFQTTYHAQNSQDIYLESQGYY